MTTTTTTAITTNGPPRILCVDDEPRVLEGLESNLGFDYDVELAGGGNEGLAALQRGPFAVIISDMRMPGMDGATFLAAARQQAPDATRLLLTGYADVDAAVSAVNNGGIFRFLNKPCAPAVLLMAVQAAVEQNRLITAEKALLEQTVIGTIKLLTEILQLCAPKTFRTAGLTKRVMAHLLDKLHLEPRWRFEAAAMLAHVGCIALSADVVDHVIDRRASAAEKTQWNTHPQIARRLLTTIPRLEDVAEIVARQSDVVDTEPADDVGRGAAMLRVSLLVADHLAEGRRVAEAFVRLEPTLRGWSRHLLDLVKDLPFVGFDGAERLVPVAALCPGMVLAGEVRSNSAVLLAAGVELTLPLIERIKRFAANGSVVEPLRVRPV